MIFIRSSLIAALLAAGMAIMPLGSALASSTSTNDRIAPVAALENLPDTTEAETIQMLLGRGVEPARARYIAAEDAAAA